MKIKVCNTTNNQLNWLVAKCEGVEAYMPKFPFKNELMIKNPFGEPLKCPDWTTDFKKCASISEKYLIITNLDNNYNDGSMSESYISIPRSSKHLYATGTTPEISALRCYIIYKLDKEVEVPDNLI